MSQALKLNAYEPSFEKQVTKIRDKEISLLKSASYYHVAAASSSTISSVLVSKIFTFAVGWDFQRRLHYCPCPWGALV